MTRGAKPYYAYDGRSEEILKLLDRERFTALEAEWLGHRFACSHRGPACEISRFTCLLSYRVAAVPHPPNHLVMCHECQKGKTLDEKFHKKFENGSTKSTKNTKKKAISFPDNKNKYLSELGALRG